MADVSVSPSAKGVALAGGVEPAGPGARIIKNMKNIKKLYFGGKYIETAPGR